MKLEQSRRDDLSTDLAATEPQRMTFPFQRSDETRNSTTPEQSRSIDQEPVQFQSQQSALGSISSSSDQPEMAGIDPNPVQRQHTATTGMFNNTTGVISCIERNLQILCEVSLVDEANEKVKILTISSVIFVTGWEITKITFYKEKLRKVNERLSGTEFSTYTGIVDTNEEVNDSGYNGLSVNTPQLLADCNRNENDTQDDGLVNQDYLVPEQHYHTIQEVEIHYAEADVAAFNSDR
ncbi:unnamed protein product [Mytilus coruscus]|uniref:Uncharacterized protein n=1 Tax=Mytilus coruscus TaxID=42192 RepID=A0A6J8D7G1_MYTCO|nr:unnamed protein product [Mytilus coruscus]